MGDGKLVPRKVNYWAYGGDSIAQRGYIGPNNLNNTDIASQINRFTGGEIQVDNFGRSHDTTSGILGKQTVRGTRRDGLGRMLEGDYEGIILEIGVNDLGGAGSRDPEVWAQQLGRMRRNIIEMYLRTYLKGAGSANRDEVLSKMKLELEKTEMELDDVKLQLRLEKSPAKIASLEDSKEFLEEKKQLLREIHQEYKVLSREKSEPKKKVKRIVFVEVAPWKPRNTEDGRAQRKAEHTVDYNEMLVRVGAEVNELFGKLDAPKFEVAHVYDVLGSRKDKGTLHSEYVGKRVRGGADYLHFGEEGRRAAAAAITLQIFPEHAHNKLELDAIVSQNKVKPPSAIARR